MSPGLPLLGPPFQGADETTFTIYFDAAEDETLGEAQSPWSEFRPEYRVSVTGSGGSLTKESIQRYSAGQWQSPQEAPDLPEFDVGLSGEMLEWVVPMSSIGALHVWSPEREGSFTFQWAAKVTRGANSDYVPDLRSTEGDEGRSNGGGPASRWYEPGSSIESTSWGGIKN